VFGEIESGRSEVAAAISVVLLAVALGLTFGARAIERLTGTARA
jgi:ABC-type sulfate transport system permease component